MLFKTRYPSMTYNQLTGKVVLKKNTDIYSQESMRADAVDTM